MNEQWQAAAAYLRAGKIGVIPTDTIYGLVATASNESSVEQVYQVKGRRFTKPCIILIAEIDNLRQFGIKDVNIKRASVYWPGSVSVVLPIETDHLGRLSYLHRGQNSLAFRVPAKKELHDLLVITGPLIAPSANPEGKEPAKTIVDAKHYFGGTLSFYVDEGSLGSAPSQLISLLAKKPERLR